MSAPDLSHRAVVHVVTNVGQFPDGTPTGLWLSELTHVYDQLEAAGVRQVIASPTGGTVPLEPRSLVPLVTLDKATRERLRSPAFMALLNQTTPVADIDWHDFDAIYLTGGHGLMYDFPHHEALGGLLRDMGENDRIVSSVCHGYCGFLGATFGDGTAFMKGHRLTGFSWLEEQCVFVAGKVPFNAQADAIAEGADYSKATLPMAPYAVVDGKLITGQNPTSAKLVGKHLIDALSR